MTDRSAVASYNVASASRTPHVSIELQQRPRGPQRRPRSLPLPSVRAIRWTFWSVLVVGGLLQLAASADVINADGTSYLDVSDQFARGDWTALRNGYWSPLYPALIGLLQRLVGWSRPHELLAVRLVGLAIAVGCAMALERFLAALSLSQRSAARDGALPLEFDGPLGRAVAYVLGLYVVLKLAPIHYVTPDLLVAALTICVGTLLLRVHQGTLGARGLLLFGATLGVASLAKSAMFPAAILSILVLPFVIRRGRRWRGVMAATLGFAIVAGPLVIEQSAARGHLTFGESGRLNYAWYVDGAARIAPLPPDAAAAVGAPIRLAKVPQVTLFPGEPLGAFSFWFDPSRWSWNAHASVDSRAQWRAVALNLIGYRLMLGVPLLLLAAFYAVGLCRPGVRVDVRASWFLVLPAVAQLAMYCLVHAEGRYVAGSIVILLLVLIGALRLPHTPEWTSMRTYLVLALSILFLARLPYAETRNGLAFASWRHGAEPQAKSIADGLARNGVRPGARVAVVGPGYDCYWARLADVHVVALVEGDDRWPSRRLAGVGPILPLLARYGIAAVVAPRSLVSDPGAGIALARTGYVLFLPRQGAGIITAR